MRPLFWQRDRPLSTAALFLMVAAIAAVMALMTASQIYLSMVDHGHSLLRMILWQAGSWAFWACSAPWVMRLAGRDVRLRVLVPLGLVLIVVHAIVAAQISAWTHPFAIGTPEPAGTHPFAAYLRQQLPYVALLDPVVYVLLIVGGRALAASERAWQLQLRESQLESDLAKAQLDALRLEIEPHFLFNTLNSIAAQIRLNENAGALSMLLRLSDLMRSTLDRGAGQYTSLGEEVAHVARYVDLQRTRFNDRLSVIYAVDPACDATPVPAFLLQPIVENALRHGLSPNVRPGRLEIGARHDGGELRLWVRDDGSGLPDTFDLQRDAGTGLKNISARLTRIYGGQASLRLRTNEAGGTTAELTLPGALRPAPVTV
jgi:two-component system, LytTR family, sensor kinase